MNEKKQEAIKHYKEMIEWAKWILLWWLLVQDEWCEILGSVGALCSSCLTAYRRTWL